MADSVFKLRRFIQSRTHLLDNGFVRRQGGECSLCRTDSSCLYTSNDIIIRQIAITGAASGMGLATAKLLASRGAIISLADINEEAVKAAAKSMTGSDKHMSTVVDVRSSQSVNAWIESTVQKLGKLDGAVNMAGVITHATPITEETDENWEFAFSVNTRGVFYCLRAQLKAMAAGGSIVGFLHDCELEVSQYTSNNS